LNLKISLALTLRIAALWVSAAGIGAFAESATPLIEFTKLDAYSPSLTHATLTVKENALSVRGDISVQGDNPLTQAMVQFSLPEAMRDLSKGRFVEIDIENTGDKPLRFTFWALSGNGWGGASTWSTAPELTSVSTDKSKPAGVEVLPPKVRRTFQIDVHACYPLPDASKRFYTAAINPASVRWLRLVLNDVRGLPTALIHSITLTGVAPKEKRDCFKRVFVPDIERGVPAAGKRVYQKLPGWENTTIEHVLTLPTEWKPGAKFPIIVEYTGNVFYYKWCHSTGFTEQGNMAYGLSRGQTFILLNLPFVSTNGQREEFNGWGSIQKTEDYCLQALRFVSENYGGDTNRVFYTGFSRGELAMNYLALRDDRIAPIWRGFIGADPAVPSAKKWLGGPGWNKCADGWDERGARLRGRPFINQHPNYGAVHVDVEYLEDSPSTVKARAWLQEMLENSGR